MSSKIQYVSILLGRALRNVTLVLFVSIALVLLGSLGFASALISTPNVFEILPPNIQISNGVPPSEVVCKSGFQIIFSPSDGMSVCVKTSSAYVCSVFIVC